MDYNLSLITTTSDKLSTLTITDGQLITLSDKAGFFYDMNNARFSVSGVQLVASLPASGQEDVLYIYNSELYIWDGTEFVQKSGAGGGGVTSFNTRTGDVTLSSTDVTAALGYTPPQQDTTYSTGVGLASSGTTFKAKLKSETLSSLTAADKGATASREYAVGVDANGNLSVNVPWSDTTYNFSGSAFVSGTNGVGDHDANSIVTNGTYYYTSNGPTTAIGASTADGGLYTQAYSSSWVGQIAQDYRNGDLFVRSKNNGTWQSWHRPIASSVNGYTVAKSVPSNAVFTDTTVASSITRTTYTGNLPGANVDAALTNINSVNTFSVATSAWSATTDYGYAFKATISTTIYRANSAPIWTMIGASTVTTKTEQAQCSLVQQAYFTASNVTLYATAKPSVALRLYVKGY